MSSILDQINQLRKEKRAVILAHTYQPAEIQKIADFTGDSYGLSVKAAQLQDAELIVFCGVRFMAETAAILNPTKKVIMPDATAGCPMAEMITGEQLRQFKAEHPGAPVVCYVNSTAEVKAESDICCTSSNALKVVRSLGDVPQILFVPDQYLGRFIQKALGRKMVMWNGCCPIHRELDPSAIAEARKQHPGAKVLVHPETRPETQQYADYVLSTGQMIDLVRGSSGKSWIVGTEQGILHALQEAAPEDTFYPIQPPLVCADMKKTTLEKLLAALENEGPQITVPGDIATKAYRAIAAMLNCH